MTDLPLAAIKRIASVRGPQFRVGEDAVALINRAATVWIQNLAEEAFVFTTHAQRSTLKATDVLVVLEKRGIKIPTISTPPRPKPTPAKQVSKKK
jgi:histone H3/H4